MKKIVGGLLCFMLLMGLAVALADVQINAQYFPDVNFLEVVKTFDLDQNGLLSDEEISNVWQIDCSERGISSLQGVEFFKGLSSLTCSDNQLSKLDVSKNTALQYLYCQNNQIQSLDVSSCSALNYILCENNQLTKLKLGNHPQLTRIMCCNNKIASLDVSSCPALTTLWCRTNQLTKLDFTNCPVLEELVCWGNQLTSLDVSQNKMLNTLSCGSNKLTTLNVSKNPALASLDCTGCQITKLDVSHNPQLVWLGCDQNRLTSLDVRNCSGLIVLYCFDNQLTSLKISSLSALRDCRCDDNKIRELDISGCTILCDLVSRVQRLSNGWKEDHHEEIDHEGGSVEIYSYSLYVDSIVSVTGTPIGPVDISDAKITTIKDQIYSGHAIQPAVQVKYDGKKLTLGKDYTVSYKNNEKIGEAKVTVTGIGDYTGTKIISFSIVPVGVKITSLTGGTKQLTVQWAKGSNISGYQLEYSLKKDFSNSATVTVGKADTTKKAIKKLSSKKTYYVRIRTFKTVKGKRYFSAWSAVKSKKTK